MSIIMKTIIKVKLWALISIIFITGCTSFISINRHNNGSCQHLDYSSSTEVKNDSTQFTIEK